MGPPGLSFSVPAHPSFLSSAILSLTPNILYLLSLSPRVLDLDVPSIYRGGNGGTEQGSGWPQIVPSSKCNLVTWPCNWLAANNHDLTHKTRNRSPGWKEDGSTAHREAAIHPVGTGLLEDTVCLVLIWSCEARLAVGWVGAVPPAGAGTKLLAGGKHANPGKVR